MKRHDRQRSLPVWPTAALVLLIAVLQIVPAQAQRSGQAGRRSERNLKIHRQKHRELHNKLMTDLERLALYCEDNNFPEDAAKIRTLAAPVDSLLMQAEPLPKQVQPEIPRSLPDEERYWQIQLQDAQTTYAKKLYLLSRRVLHAGSPSYAYHLVRETARHNPDHRSTRRLLGYIRNGTEWVTPFTAQMRRRRFVWHDQYGWLPKSHVGKYESGRRFFKGRWISAAQEAEFRRDFKLAWKVRSDHYLIKTNHSLERGVEVAGLLEGFHEHFVQTFAGFFSTPEQMQKLFNGNGPRSSDLNKPYEVHYYRTRDEYNERLASKIPQIAITNGLYYTTDRTAYFYHDPSGANERTLYHEATHQLLYESSPRDRPIAVNENFWIIEGIACYMESFTRQNGRLSLGDPRNDRFVAARNRYLNDEYYVPLGQFTRMGMQQFQSDMNIRKNYSQASGLAHFLMHYENGRYRDALVQHLSEIYNVDPRRSGTSSSLDELASTTFADLDRQYGRYLKHLQDGLDRLRQRRQ